MQTPLVTRLLLGANIAVFVLTMRAGQGFYSLFGLLPADFHFWQPLTSMFLHGGLAHVGFNMLALWSIGAPLERDLGPSRFAALYFISGIGGAALVLFLPLLSAVGLEIGDPTIATIGASGAIAGLLGALAVFYPRATMLLFLVIPVKARTLAIGFGVVSLYLMFTQDGPGISHSGHLGGLIAGLAYSKFAIDRARARRQERVTVMPPVGSAPYGRTQMMQELLRDFMRDPRGSMRNQGRFLDSSGHDDPHETAQPHMRGGFGGDVEPQKRLYYDPATGTFFFR